MIFLSIVKKSVPMKKRYKALEGASTVCAQCIHSTFIVIRKNSVLF